MIHNRDKDTILVGDSGGFQIATGVIKMDWTKVMTDEGDPLREEILRYLEHTSDWSMTLDVPAFAAKPPLNSKTGLTTFEQCLDVTEYNLMYFLTNRVPGATKFLNVLSGSELENSKTWYDCVKKYSQPEEVAKFGLSEDRTFEGWAFAGINMRVMKAVLERILDLRADNLLATKDWIHFLGVGRLDWACYLTSIERVLRKYDNPNLTISFDAASPFVAAGGYALSYNYNKFNPDQLTYAMGRGVDKKHLKGSKLAAPFQGPIMERLNMGDLCVKGEGDLNRNKKVSKSSWDTTTYALIMAHNVYNHIHAVQEVNRLADLDYATRKKVDHKDWFIQRDRKKMSNMSPFIPNTIIWFNDYVEKLLDPKNLNPRAMLEEHYIKFLDYISFGANEQWTTFGSLWEIPKEAAVMDHTPTAEDLVDIANHLDVVMRADDLTERLAELFDLEA
jgi:hypothetical protein